MLVIAANPVSFPWKGNLFFVRFIKSKDLLDKPFNDRKKFPAGMTFQICTYLRSAATPPRMARISGLKSELLKLLA